MCRSGWPHSTALPLHLQYAFLSTAVRRKEWRREGGRERRKRGRRERKNATVYPLVAYCVQVSIPSYFLPSSYPCHSTETALTGVIDDLLASDGQLQSFVLWISTHLSLRVSHSSLLIVHTLVSVTLYYSDFPPAKPLYISILLKYVCSFISWSHLLSQVTLSPGPSPFSFGFSYVFYENSPCLLWGWISYLNLFSFLSPQEEPIHHV